MAVTISGVARSIAAQQITEGSGVQSPASERRPDYVLQPQDSLRVFIFQHEDLNKQMDSVQVSPEHTVSLPLVGTISVRGLTARQAESAIREAFDRDFIVNPQVSVVVVKYAERSVNVLGQVGKPIVFPFPMKRDLPSSRQSLWPAGPRDWLTFDA